MQIPVVRVTLPRHCYVYYHSLAAAWQAPDMKRPPENTAAWLPAPLHRQFHTHSKKKKKDAWNLKVNCISPFQKLICSWHYPAFASFWIIPPFPSHEKQTFLSLEETWILHDKHNPKLLSLLFFFFFARDIVRVWQPRGPPSDSDGVINTFIQ